MENIAIKLDYIAELLGKVFVENIARTQFGKRIQGKESALSLCRYDHNDNYMKQNPSSPNERNSKTCDFTFCLHLPATPSRFLLPSAQGRLSLDAGPDTILVVVGHRIEVNLSLSLCFLNCYALNFCGGLLGRICLSQALNCVLTMMGSR